MVSQLLCKQWAAGSIPASSPLLAQSFIFAFKNTKKKLQFLVSIHNNKTVALFNKTETAVQSQDDEKNWHGRQSLNLIKKTENPLQDSAIYYKILQESASIHRSLSSCHTAKTARFCKKLQDSARFCKILQDSARFCKTLQDSAKFCKIRQDLARVCNHSQVIKQLPYCKKVEIRTTIQQYNNNKHRN